MRGSLPGEKSLMWGTCWVSIRTTPAVNHNFKDQHKSTTNHLRRTHKNTLILLHGGQIKRQREGVWCSTRMAAACTRTVMHIYVVPFICDNKPPCSLQNENTFLPRGGPHLSLQTHTELEPNVVFHHCMAAKSAVAMATWSRSTGFKSIIYN